MNAPVKRTLIIAAACAVPGVVWLTLVQSSPEDHPGKTMAPSALPAPHPHLPKPELQPASTPKGNAAALAELKARSVSLMQSPAGRGDEIANLIRDSVTRLGCSGELVSLLKFIESSPEFMAATLNFQERVDTVMEEQFLTNAGPRMREGLLAIKDRSFRQRWAYAAAQGCAPGDYQAFAARLGDEDSRKYAVWGYLQGLAKADIAAALAGTLQSLERDREDRVPSAYASTALEKLLSAIPQNADFGALERQLPAPAAPGQDDRARITLLTRWGQFDPPAAATYVMAHPERIAPAAMGFAVDPFLRTQPAKAIDWIQDLPEGPYYDAAVLSALSMLRSHFNGQYAREAQQLAEQISDPVVREREVRRLHTPRTPTR